MPGGASRDVAVFVHGTTLATNAVIERRGARTALLATEGFRDILDIANESRYDQYDLTIEKPKPLVPRALRFTVPERMDVHGKVRLALDEGAVRALAGQLEAAGIESVAVAFMHSYVNPAHERRTREILKAALPDLWLTLSSEVCPEVREYERTSTAVANAYVQPLMDSYLERMQTALAAEKFTGTIYLVTSGGGLTAIETARRFPVRLVESGPAGGAIFAAQVAARAGEARALSYDMGGTTAKICLIDDYKPHTARLFEVDRAARFLKGSGLPVRIPVIEMVEIGAGGGSIARLDALKRVTVGPESAGAEPGPACYGRGGTHPAVTDANVVLGTIDPDDFAGGTHRARPRCGQGRAGPRRGRGPRPVDRHGGLCRLRDGVGEHGECRPRACGRARRRGQPVQSDRLRRRRAAACRARRREDRRQARDRAAQCRRRLGGGLPGRAGLLRAGAQPLHAPRRLRCRRRQRAPEGDERGGHGAGRAGRARPGDLRAPHGLHALCRPGPRDHGRAAAAAPCRRRMPRRCATAYERDYAALFERHIPNAAIEILSWSVQVSTEATLPARQGAAPAAPPPQPVGTRPVFDGRSGRTTDVPVYRRESLPPGSAFPGPAIVAEDETSTYISASFAAHIDASGCIVMDRKDA